MRSQLGEVGVPMSHAEPTGVAVVVLAVGVDVVVGPEVYV